ncbi:hypothetical protein GJ496_001627 [Pomphorhynchus laevis]|nr:hypothetical protein GJ496_001627 [Pomphorhynchus laevis]
MSIGFDYINGKQIVNSESFVNLYGANIPVTSKGSDITYLGATPLNDEPAIARLVYFFKIYSMEQLHCIATAVAEEMGKRAANTHLVCRLFSSYRCTYVHRYNGNQVNDVADWLKLTSTTSQLMSLVQAENDGFAKLNKSSLIKSEDISEYLRTTYYVNKACRRLKL